MRSHLISLPYSLHRVGTFLSAFLLTISLSPSATALEIEFNGGALLIVDNGAGDLNASLGVIDFNTTIGSYQLQGTVDTVAGPNLVSLIGGPTASLRLTNFTAEALAPSLPQLGIKFSDTLAGTYTSINAADSIDAYAAHVTGAPIPPAQDYLRDWQGYVDGWPIFPYAPGSPPYPNPFVPPFSSPVPYTVVTQGPTTITAPFNNPVISAYLTIQLGGTGDQFILNNSAEIGFTSVPEASSVILMGLGSLGLGALAIRRRQSA